MKTCRHCGKEFAPARPLQAVCSPKCARAATVVAKKAAKASERASTKARREKLKTRQDWAREAQAIVNKYVRMRDWWRGCISCDKGHGWDGQWHASHFRSVGAASALRFNLWNIHKSCSVCNNWKSGNLAEYLPRMVERFGQDRVDWLMAQNQLADYSVDYLQRLKSVMGKRLKRLEGKL